MEDALVAVEAGADAVGFVFYEKSPRCVTAETVREIVGKLPENVEKVGVFVNEPIENVSAIADSARLTAVQFHGDEYEDPENRLTDRRTFRCIPAQCVSMIWRKRGKAFGSFMALPRNTWGDHAGFEYIREAWRNRATLRLEGD